MARVRDASEGVFAPFMELSMLTDVLSVTQDDRPLPPVISDPDADAAQFDATDAWIEPPCHVDYGTQVHIGPGAFINSYSTFIDTCHIYIGARTLVAPHVSFFSGRHPLDPAVRKGTTGPEDGREIHIGEDCWIGGNATILPGITIGRGSTVGAGSVVTKVNRPAGLMRYDINTGTGRPSVSRGCWQPGKDYPQD